MAAEHLNQAQACCKLAAGLHCFCRDSRHWRWRRLICMRPAILGRSNADCRMRFAGAGRANKTPLRAIAVASSSAPRLPSPSTFALGTRRRPRAPSARKRATRPLFARPWPSAHVPPPPLLLPPKTTNELSCKSSFVCLPSSRRRRRLAQAEAGQLRKGLRERPASARPAPRRTESA